MNIEKIESAAKDLAIEAAMAGGTISTEIVFPEPIGAYRVTVERIEN